MFIVQRALQGTIVKGWTVTTIKLPRNYRKNGNIVDRRRQLVENHRTSLSSSSSSSSNGITDNILIISIKGFCIGTIAGILGSLAGMGGGFVMIPLMTNTKILSLTQHQAHGTSLAAIVTTGCAGALSYSKFVQYETAFIIACTGIVSARYGAKLSSNLSSKSLKISLGILMLCMAPAVHIKEYLLQQHHTTSNKTSNNNSSIRIENDSQNSSNNDNTRSTFTETTIPTKDDITSRFIIPGIIGIGSGYLAGLFGVGGGVLVVPALTLLCDNTINNHYEALGTSLAAMILPALSGTYTHYNAGNVVVRLVPGLCIGAFTGAYIGGKISIHTNETILRYGFSTLLTILGIRTILKA